MARRARANGNAARDRAAPLRFAHRRARRVRIGARRATTARPSVRPRSSSAIGACMLCELKPRLGQPLLQVARPPPGCDNRSACAWRRARPPRSRAPRSRAGDRGSAAGRDRGASTPRTAHCCHRPNFHCTEDDRLLAGALDRSGGSGAMLTQLLECGQQLAQPRRTADISRGSSRT